MMTSRYQVLDKHTIVDIICSKLTSHRMTHLTLHLRCDIALRNPLYIMVLKCIGGGNWSTEKNTVNCTLPSAGSRLKTLQLMGTDYNLTKMALVYYGISPQKKERCNKHLILIRFHCIHR